MQFLNHYLSPKLAQPKASALLDEEERAVSLSMIEWV